MKIDFSQIIRKINDDPIKEPDGKDFTLGSACINSLLADPEVKISGEEKVNRYNLALAIHAAREPLDLKIEEAAKIKQLVGETYTALVVGQAWKMLEQQDRK